MASFDKDPNKVVLYEEGFENENEENRTGFLILLSFSLNFVEFL